MKKYMPYVIIFMCCVFLSLSSCGPKLTDIVVTDMPAVTIAGIAAENESAAAMGDYIVAIQTYLEGNNINPDDTRFLTIYEDPQNMMKKWIIGAVVYTDVDITDRVDVYAYPEIKTAAVTTMTGSYFQLKTAHTKLKKWIDENGYIMNGPIFEEYLTDPNVTPANENMIRIWVSVEK